MVLEVEIRVTVVLIRCLHRIGQPNPPTIPTLPPPVLDEAIAIPSGSSASVGEVVVAGVSPESSVSLVVAVKREFRVLVAK